MTEATYAGTVRAIDVTSEAARRRLRRRYAREARFKAYGLAAIAFAAIFIVVLLADIVVKALPATTTAWLDLDVLVKAETVDPSNSRNPSEIARGDFEKAARDALLALFPEAAKDRKARRTMQSLLSASAAEGLKARVVADPSLIGSVVPANLQLSGDAELYVKGLATERRTVDGLSTATPSGTSGAVEVVLGAGAAELARLTSRTRADGSAPASLETLDATTPSVLLAINGGMIKVAGFSADRVRGEVLLPLDSAVPAGAGKWRAVIIETPEDSRKITDVRAAYLEALAQAGVLSTGFNWGFFTSGDSREAELAGILSSLVGSALTMLVTLALCLPIGVLAAIYLEEFAPKNRFTDLVEVNINNLAAVPSIVFGLLGLAVFIGFFGIPASSPLVGGLVLSLLVLPTIIIASRAALKSVPPSIREAALGVGASKQQAVFHHVLPLAMPGILTGTIIGMAHALGETAPLLMIGMIAFIVDVPGSLTQSATVLPVQIFLWSDLPELGFQAKTALAILVLLAFLFVMNGMAILLRKRFERRW